MARAAPCSTPASSWRHSRALAPIGGYATTPIVAGATKGFGTEEQKEEILGGIAAGAVQAIAMTEPEAGSDVAALSTFAESVDGAYVLQRPEGLLLDRPHATTFSSSAARLARPTSTRA